MNYPSANEQPANERPTGGVNQDDAQIPDNQSGDLSGLPKHKEDETAGDEGIDDPHDGR